MILVASNLRSDCFVSALTAFRGKQWRINPSTRENESRLLFSFPFFCLGCCLAFFSRFPFWIVVLKMKLAPRCQKKVARGQRPSSDLGFRGFGYSKRETTKRSRKWSDDKSFLRSFFLLSCCSRLPARQNCSMGFSQNEELMAQSVENLEIGTLGQIKIPRSISCQPQVLSNTAMLETSFSYIQTAFSQIHLRYQYPSQQLIQWIELDQLFTRKKSGKKSGNSTFLVVFN